MDIPGGVLEWEGERLSRAEGRGACSGRADLKGAGWETCSCPVPCFRTPVFVLLNWVTRKLLKYSLAEESSIENMSFHWKHAFQEQASTKLTSISAVKRKSYVSKRSIYSKEKVLKFAFFYMSNYFPLHHWFFLSPEFYSLHNLTLHVAETYF